MMIRVIQRVTAYLMIKEFTESKLFVHFCQQAFQNQSLYIRGRPAAERLPRIHMMADLRREKFSLQRIKLITAL